MTALVAGKIAEREERSDLRYLQVLVINLMQTSMGLPAEVGDEALRIRVEHADLLNQLSVDVLAWNDRRQLAAITSLIQNRLDGFEEWDETLVQRHLTARMMGYLYDFFYAEETHQIRAQDDERTEVDEDEMVGKLSEASTENPPNPTGEESSGGSSSSTPAAKSSATSDSEVSPSSESSVPTKQGKSRHAPTSTSKSSRALSSRA